MAAIVLTPNNFGSTLDTTTEPGKFNAKIDDVTIKRAVDGALYSTAAVVPRHVTGITRMANDLVVSYSDGTAETINICC